MKIWNAILVSGLVIGSIIFLLRSYGENKVYKTRVHPALQDLANKHLSDKPVSWKQKNVAAFLQVQVHEEELFFLFDQQKVSASEFSAPPTSPIFIQILSDQKEVNYLLNQWVEKENVSEAVVIYSRTKNVIVNIRNVVPRWLTALAENEVFNCILLHKMALSSLCSLDASFLFINQDFSTNYLRELPLKELQKRKIWIVSEDESLLNHYPYTLIKY